MEQHFTTKDIETLFGVSHQSAKNWSDEFAEYLSPTARPTPGHKRVFTSEDMRVFALVAENQKAKFRYEDAHRALKMGQRGEIPTREGELPAVPPAILTRLREEMKNRDALIIALTTERDKATGRVEQLEKLLHEKDQRIEELITQLASLRVQVK